MTEKTDIIQTNIAKALQRIRMDQNISQEKLSLGICHLATYSRYETGERTPDRLTLNALFQRLGKDAGKLSYQISREEYDYFSWKRQVLLAMEQNDFQQIAALLRKPEGKASAKHGNKKLQEQFLCQIKAILCDQKIDMPIPQGDPTHPEEGKICLLKEAIELTMPGFTPTKLNQYLISVQEAAVLMDYAEALVKNHQTQEGIDLLEGLLAYVDFHYSDTEAKVKVVPRVTIMLIPLLLEKKEYERCMLLSQTAVELLRSLGMLHGMVTLMEGYIEASNHLHRTDRTIRYEKQKAALQALYQEYQTDSPESEKNSIYYQNQELYLIHEVIRSARLNQNLSQEELSEEICSPENMSRIESGEHAPNNRTFSAIMNRLGKDMVYYESGLQTSNFLLLEKKEGIRLGRIFQL